MRRHSTYRMDRGWENGFSLVELVVIIAIAGIIVAGMLPFIKLNLQSYTQAAVVKNQLQQARIGYNRLFVELNAIESSIDIDYGDSDSIRFDLPEESNISYSFSNNQLNRNGVKMIGNVQAFALTYFLEDGSGKSPGFAYDSDVWRIQISLNVGDSGDQFQFRGSVSPRNIHYN